MASTTSSCTGSPDAVTVYGGRNVASYDLASNGDPAFDEVGYSYGLAVTWSLPTTRSARQDALQAEQVELLRALAGDAHDANVARGAAPAATTVTVSPATVELPPGFGHEDDNTITAKTKTILGLVAGALGVAIIAALKRLGVRRKRAKAHPG
jgi:hypothetical protein